MGNRTKITAPASVIAVPEFVAQAFGTSDPAAIVAKKKDLTTKGKAYGTSRPSPVTMTPDTCKAYCDMVGVTYLDGYEGRVLQYTITDETVDRYGDIVRAAGLDVTGYQKNPTILYIHEHRQLPVGKTIKLEFDAQAKKWVAWGLFMDDRVDTTGVAKSVFNMASNGFLPGCSIGFMPKKINYPNAQDRVTMGLGDWGVEILESDLLEWSPVTIPANPNAIQEGINGGLIKRKDLQSLVDADLFSRDVFAQVKDIAAVVTAPAPDVTPTPQVPAADFEAAVYASVMKALANGPELLARAGAEISQKNKDKIQKISDAWETLEGHMQAAMDAGETLEQLIADLLGTTPDESETGEGKSAAPASTKPGEKQIPVPEKGSATTAASPLYGKMFQGLDSLNQSLKTKSKG